MKQEGKEFTSVQVLVTGKLVHWYSGTLVHWYTGTMVHWCTGTLVKEIKIHRRVLAFFLSCTAGLINYEPGQYSNRLCEFLSFADGKQKTRVKNLKTTF